MSQSVKDKAQVAFDALVEYTWTDIVESHESNSDAGQTLAEALLHEQVIGLASTDTIYVLDRLARATGVATDPENFLAAIKRVVQPQLDEYGLDLKWVWFSNGLDRHNFIHFCPAGAHAAS